MSTKMNMVTFKSTPHLRGGWVGLFSFLLLLLSISSYAQSDGIPDRPNPPRLVNIYSESGFISNDEQARLEQKLQTFANETSNQIVIIIADDLGGREPWEYAAKLGEKWGVGQKGNDNGIVILIKPSGGKGQRQYFIAPGRGLEGAIPDLTCRQIEENELLPNLKSGNYFDALDKTTNVLMSLAKAEYSSDAYGKKHSRKRLPMGLIIPLIFIILFVILRSGKGGGGSGGLSMGTGFFLGSMLGGGRGFGGGGGGSSGGFGGFGGGGFGGGGSGGSW